MFPRFPGEHMKGDPVEGLDQIPKHLSIVGFNGSGVLGTCRLFPSSNVRAFAFSRIDPADVVASLSFSDHLPSRPHPYAREQREEANGSATSVSFGKKHNDDQLDNVRPSSNALTPLQQPDD
jgi:hypothetical protein